MPAIPDWNAFFALRAARSLYSRAAVLPSAVGGFCAGVHYFASHDIDPSQPVWGIDPFMVYGAATFACAAGAGLLGAPVGAGLWALVHRRCLPEFSAREALFLRRIRARRVDPRFQSYANPVPDYYGEKITSVAAYRKWLRDQRKYNRKREKFL